MIYSEYFTMMPNPFSSMEDDIPYPEYLWQIRDRYSSDILYMQDMNSVKCGIEYTNTKCRLTFRVVAGYIGKLSPLSHVEKYTNTNKDISYTIYFSSSQFTVIDNFGNNIPEKYLF